MRKGIIKECKYLCNTASMKLKIDIDNTTKELTISDLKFDYVQYFRKGEICEFEMKDKNISKLIVGGKEIPLSKPDIGSSKMHRRDATAPYNFVPVNKDVVTVPDALPDFDRYTEFTGYIDLDIMALTPLYIRDTYTKQEEMKAKDKNRKQQWINPDFFSPGGILSIPGSSLRGMVRNLVEIVSFSRMEYVDDSTFYYRPIGDKCKTVRDAYFKIMEEKDKANSSKYKFCAGYLCKEDNKYFIRPAQKRENEKQYKRVSKAGRPEFSYHWQEDGSCITVSGAAPNKKEEGWLIFPLDEKSDPIELSMDVINAYRNDVNRMTDKKEKELSKRRDGDLLRMLELAESDANGLKKVPCFYIGWRDENGNERIAFGHTAYFRLPYELSVHDHIPACHKDEDTIDFARAIFGSTRMSAGKVFFEDAKSVGYVHQYEELYPAILSDPKPTTFQHYLEQGDAKERELKHWGDKPDNETGTGFIRGHKLYWHRKTLKDGEFGWKAEESEVQKNPLQYTKIKPVKEPLRKNGKYDKINKFKCRIRFENLSKIELGALLFVLDLPSDCAHKLGMGKPLGLGTIKIRPRLVITERNKGTDDNPGRYEKLFENRRWHLPYINGSGMHEEFKSEFSNYILNKLGESGYDNLWDIPRLRELRAMLYYNEKNMHSKKWLSNTKYMKLGEFKERPILDSPSNVLKRANMDIPKRDS
ncbi:TIGR03986 family CRISPR-associated RAMP protein [Acetivibrio saccincola]|mgnify:FL=1|jgi:CRISPR/Cas system CSM-associated protein Csm3 (group 7 of RAMP superfamily)|uniref:CRISPR-associated RAMP family protein n=1 Tax=Acetivibrio saccincola TaxID=1677857 RepID=A0A2S8R6X2_9FIRM|nr:TIGR03986 family CRISPR-associated RAMP protein [Acetivibrio saccincola]PQQ65545.1 CRISPR-associated RAMP family protein [Acetivibrio saccincola]